MQTRRAVLVLAIASLITSPHGAQSATVITDINQSVFVAACVAVGCSQKSVTGGLGHVISYAEHLKDPLQAPLSQTNLIDSAGWQHVQSTSPGVYQVETRSASSAVGPNFPTAAVFANGAIGFRVEGQAEQLDLSVARELLEFSRGTLAGRLFGDLGFNLDDGTNRVLLGLQAGQSTPPISRVLQPGNYRLTWDIKFVADGRESATNTISGIDTFGIALSNATEVPGISQTNPFFPPGGLNAGTFVFNLPPSKTVKPGLWYEPPMVPGYAFATTDGSRFKRIDNFPFNIDGDGLFLVTSGGRMIGFFGPGDSVDFIARLGAGVSSFEVSAIDPAVDAESPTAFPIQLSFDTDGASFTMTPLPEPGIGLMLGYGALGLVGLGRSRRDRA